MNIIIKIKLVLLCLLLAWSSASFSDQPLTDEQSKQIEQQWRDKVNRFLDKIYETEGIDYRNDKPRSDALDIFIKALANDPANQDKPTDWFLNEAHAKVNAVFNSKNITTDNQDGDFVKVGSSKDDKLTLYVFSKITRIGNIVKVWVLTDYKNLQKNNGDKQYLSHKSMHEINCQSEETRLLRLTSYSKHMGEGEILYNSKFMNNDWEPIIPQSVYSNVKDYSCVK